MKIELILFIIFLSFALIISIVLRKKEKISKEKISKEKKEHRTSQRRFSFGRRIHESCEYYEGDKRREKWARRAEGENRRLKKK